MSLSSAVNARVRALFRRGSADAELAEEIRFHIDTETAKNVRAGMPHDEARRLTIAHFGGVQRVREEHRDVRRAQWIEDFFADVRFALRSLRRTPALTGAAVITLALGIGANVAIFSAVNAVVLRPLPFPASDRLMTIGENNPEKHWHMQFAAPANMLDWRAGVADFQDVAAYFEDLNNATLTGRGDTRSLSVSTVTGNFFLTLGVRPALGRTFTFDETFATGTHLTVLSDKAWREQFGADPSIVGKSVVLNGRTFQVIGVMPAGFAFPKEGVDLWRTFEYTTEQRAGVSFRRAHGIRVVARLRPGVTEQHANAQLQAVVRRLQHEYPATNAVMGAGMTPLHDFLIGDTRLPLLVLLTSVAFLLLIACANVGNLLLVQAAGRQREAALRLALGAGRGRVIRQALTESIVLSAIGGACGLAVGWLGTRALVRLQPAGMLRVHDFGLDLRVLAYAVAITLVSGILFGIAPALWSRHRDPADTLKDGGRSGMQSGRVKRWAEALVIAEVALALVMTVGAGLLVRSFVAMRGVNPGFDPNLVWVGAVGLNHAYDTDEKMDVFMRDLQTRARGLPGVTNAALAMNVPLTGASWTSDFIGYGRPAGDYGTEVEHSLVSPGYFRTMKVPLLRGREFTDGDTPKTTPVIVINQTLARSYFPGQDPVGQRITFDRVPTTKSTWLTIVGVVGDEHADDIATTPRIEVYEASTQNISNYMMLVVRTTQNPTAVTGSVRHMLMSIDPTLALTDVTTMDSLRDASLARARFLTLLMLVFGMIGLVLAVVGVYGVLAQVSRNRTREMGIRLALGARANQLRWLVVRQGLGLAGVGLVLGGVIALLSTRVMANLLFGVAPNDPLTLVSVALLLAATSVVAAWIPAQNASRADPSSALRAD